MSTWLWIVATYIAIGGLLAVVGPLRKELEVKKLVMAATNPDIPQWRFTALRFFTLSGAGLLWPLFLPGVLLANARKNSELTHDHVTTGSGLADGKLRFDHMGGLGKIGCVDCGYAENVMSFTHGVVGRCTGYQCQTCGKFTSRNYEEPFARIDGYAWLQCPILELDPKYRPRRIEHEQDLIHIVESQMKERPKEEWLETWEPDLAELRERLSQVPKEELDHVKRVRDEVNAKYEASLVCECGGKLDREKILFCPHCRSTKLTYGMEYIT